jgi:phosphatidylserine decarboxylase
MLIIGTIYIVVIMSLILFYRIPVRKLSNDSTGAIVAPCDGVVKAIEEDHASGRTRIIVFLNIFDQHLQYYPISGRVIKRDYVSGTFAPAYALEKSQFNERLRLEVRHATGADVGITQIAGQIARRIVNHADVGDNVHQGDHMGMIKLSSRVDIDFPSGTWKSIEVKVGDRIRALETKLAI